MLPESLSPLARARSIRHALRGIVTLLGSQPNAQFHLLAAAVVIGAACYWQLAARDWALLAIAIGVVWSLEAINTALEVLCDKVEPDYDPKIKVVKDVAAAGVFLAATMAVAVGLAVFLPYWLP
jgi:diacylglycerol kinase